MNSFLLLSCLFSLLKIWSQARHALLQRFAHHLNLAPDEAKVGIFLANEAKYETVDGSGDVECFIVLNEKCLQLVLIEGFIPKLDVLVADVCEYGCL